MTELIWDGKYKDGRKSAPLRVALPFQTVETVNESTADRQRTRNLFAEGKETDWRNRLIWGDKKYVLPSLLSEFAGKVNLIYIDPPFDTGADFSFTTTIPDSDESFTKEPSIIEQKAYRDTWGRGLDSYLQWFYETVVLLHELLAEDGSLYVHLDWHVGHYAKVVLDEVFGNDNFRNEVVVARTRKNYIEPERAKALNVAYDTILIYAKSDRHRIKPPYKEERKEARWHSLDAPNWSGGRPNLIYELFGQLPPPGRCWAWEKEKAEAAIKEGRLRPNPKTGKPEYLIPASDKSLCNNLWDDFNAYSFRYDYPTEKNEALLERIIKASTRDPSETYVPDLVLDCFIGSGTTAAVAEKLGRRWMACDLGRFAIHTTRKRLLEIPNVRPFVVQNLGKYERQAWQATEFSTAENAESAEKRQRAYIEFILSLYHAKPINGYAWLHGVKGGRMVHVGAVDAPVSVGDVTNIAAEFRRAVGTGKDAPATNGVDVLGWDFAFELNEVARQQAAAANINVRFLRIPRDVMDRRAVEQGDIKFFELAALSVDVNVQKAEGRQRMDSSACIDRFRHPA
jgi:adenine-specific DNA-methyltransferase